MRAAILVAIGGIVLAGPGALAAQEPVIKRPAQDTTGTDTLPPRPDSVSSTQRLLKAEQGERVRLRPLPHAGTATVLPPGGRIVLTRDSIDWAVAGDLGELLARVPGVYLERGGWLTAPDQPNYLGLGAGSVEYYLDGVPWRPIGVDSVAADPSIMPLGFLDRVEIEPTPGMLRVFLFTRAHDRESPRTKIGAAQGDRGTSRYFGSFERRYVNGLGLGLAADYLSLNRNGAGFGGGNIASGWAQFGYVPSPHFGVQAQLVTERVSRNLLMDDAATDTLARQVDGTRTDEQLRASWHGRSDGLGSSLDLIAAHSSWASDSAPGKVGIGTLGGIFAVRHPTWSSQVSLWHDTQWMPLDARFEAGIAPMGWFSSTVETAMQSYGAGRRAVWGQVRIGLRGPAGLSAGAAIGGGQRLLTPAIAAAKPQRFTDAEVNAAFTSRLLTIDAAYRWNDAWRPVAFPEFMAIDSYAPLPDIHWVTGHARLSPLNWLTLETVYQHPLGGVLPDAVPPEHAISTLTIRSRFLRNFPSGIFDLKLQGIAESWSPGTAGFGPAGVPVPLPGVTLYRVVIQMMLKPFIVYYDRVNLQANRHGSVPGYVIEPLGSTFGVRWEFSN